MLYFIQFRSSKLIFVYFKKSFILQFESFIILCNCDHYSRAEIYYVCMQNIKKLIVFSKEILWFPPLNSFLPWIITKLKLPKRNSFHGNYSGNMVFVHYGPSMMSQGKNPWKEPKEVLEGSEGSFQVKDALERPL